MLADGVEFHRFQNEMAEEESQVHGRIAEVGGLIIDKRETAIVNEDVLGAVIAVAHSFLGGQHPVGNLPDLGGNFGPALLDAAIERIDSQLDEHGMVTKRLDQMEVLRGGFMHETQD